MTPSARSLPTSLSAREMLLRVTAPEPFDQARERVINDNDILPLNYLALGEKAARPVVRLIVRQPTGQTSFGTGFMVSPRLMMTNYHVFDDKPETSGLALFDLVAASLIEFDYVLDDEGLPMDSTRFRLRPDEFLTASLPNRLDYVLVAVEPTAADDPQRTLPEFGYLKLIGITGKASTDEKLSIIHHPKGDYKSLSIRDKKLTQFVDENFIQYEADTERGSSGAPIFNDQWLVVALHHESVPKRNGDDIINRDGSVHQPGESDELIRWVANKGVRISAIIDDLKTNFADDTPLLLPLFNLATLKNVGPKPPILTPSESILPDQPLLFTMPTNGLTTPAGTIDPAQNQTGSGRATAMSQTTIQFTIPLEVSIRVGAITAGGAVSASAASSKATDSFEKVRPSPQSYADRNGYDPAFLTGADISLDKLLEPIKNELAPTFDQKTILAYRNFSIAINRNRRMTAATAANIDGKRTQSLGRSDVWILDPRMREQFQTGPEVYSRNDLDRGHMVRRLDPVWGNQAFQANQDTFHYTNSCPQHVDLNQKAWNDLEDYILNNTKLEKLRATVFTGPVLGPTDLPYRGVLLPLQFWKVAAVIKKDGKLSMTGYILSQKNLLVDLQEDISETGFSAFRTYQVPLSLLQTLTRLDFAPYFASDPLNRPNAVAFEAASDLHEIKEELDLIL